MPQSSERIGNGMTLPGAARPSGNQPVVGYLIVVMQVLLALPIRPVLIATREAGCLPKLLCGDLDAIPSQAGVVIEHAPGHGVLVRTHAEKAAERHHRIGHTSTDLVDHHPLNRADVLAAAVVNSSAFHPA